MSPASSPATSAPESAVKKIMPVMPCEQRLNNPSDLRVVSAVEKDDDDDDAFNKDDATGGIYIKD